MVLFLLALALPAAAQAPPASPTPVPTAAPTAAAPASPAQVPSPTPAPAPAPVWRPFAEFSPLVGSWSGAATASERFGGRVAHFSMELAGTAFVERTSTIFPAEEGKPEEAFEEVGYVTYSREKRRYMATYFFSTGVSGTFDVEILPDGGIRMTSGALSNYEAGARSRRVFARKADGSLDLSLDLAPSGKDFAPFLSGTLKKK
ncbi:MAG: heme-binding beta-barrel domain-containing protein [Thermoanaerobaculia bacterium]